MLTLALLIAVTAPSASVAPAVAEALDRAIAIPGARLEIRSFRAGGSCTAEAAEVSQPISASGRVAVRLRGLTNSGPCEAWAWADVRLFAKAFVATHAIREGESLQARTRTAEIEVRSVSAPVVSIPDGAVAASPIAAGSAVEARHLRNQNELRPGSAVEVDVVASGIRISQRGRAVPCVPGRACAVLPSGRRVEGNLVAGRIVLESL